MYTAPSVRFYDFDWAAKQLQCKPQRRINNSLFSGSSVGYKTHRTKAPLPTTDADITRYSNRMLPAPVL